jgi:hypothetical protein
MKIEQQISQIHKLNQEGFVNISKTYDKITVGEKIYNYLASGLSKEVYYSPCGKWVLKIPKTPSSYHVAQIKHEVACYNEAPDWCKTNVAESYFLDVQNGWMLQERLNIEGGGLWFRELGRREDNTLVIFDCDVLLTHNGKKPPQGYNYIENFSLDKDFGEAYKEAQSIPRKRQVVNSKYLSDKYGENYTIKRSRNKKGTQVWINDILIPEEEVKMFK